MELFTFTIIVFIIEASTMFIAFSLFTYFDDEITHFIESYINFLHSLKSKKD